MIFADWPRLGLNFAPFSLSNAEVSLFTVALSFGIGFMKLKSLQSADVIHRLLNWFTMVTFLYLFVSCQVLRAQNLVAAEAALSGPGQPGGVPPSRGIPTSQEGMALPKGLLHSGALSESSMNARQKIQAKIDSERFIKPTPKDTTRFQPKQVGCVLSCTLLARVLLV